MQIQQVLDACLFGVSFLLAWGIRSNDEISRRACGACRVIIWSTNYVGTVLCVDSGPPVDPGGQGFYYRPLLSSRRTAWWPLLRGCVIATSGWS